MMNEEVILEAKIEKKASLNQTLLGVISILMLGLFIVSMIPVKKVDRFDLGYSSYDTINVFGERIYWYRSWHDGDQGYDSDQGYDGIFERSSSTIGFIGTIATLPIAIYLSIISTSARGSSLVLKSDSVEGKLKNVFGSTKEMKLPFDNISSMLVTHGLIDKMLSGKTVRIASSSGIIRFPCITNADEFVNKTLEKIEESKHYNSQLTTSPHNSTPQSSDNSSVATKIKELKDLLDGGLISQEEFEQKRQELLSKM